MWAIGRRLAWLAVPLEQEPGGLGPGDGDGLGGQQVVDERRQGRRAVEQPLDELVAVAAARLAGGPAGRLGPPLPSSLPALVLVRAWTALLDDTGASPCKSSRAAAGRRPSVVGGRRRSRDRRACRRVPA
jgi:hypothetical protein